ncbi:hypothetical protein V6N11_070960 [Hibiscus sabdariffa]
MGDRLDLGCMRHEDLRVLEVPSEVPSWLSIETMAIVNRVDYDILMGLDIVKLERQPTNVTTSEQFAERNETNGVLSHMASDAQLVPLDGKLRKVCSVSNVVFSLM